MNMNGNIPILGWFSDGSGGSGFNPIAQTTIDITGLTTIDMTGKNGYGIINLTSSNATETIDIISNILTTQNYIFRPSPTLSITWNDITMGGLGVNLKLFAPSMVTYGAMFGFMALQARMVGGDIYQTNYIDQYTS